MTPSPTDRGALRQHLLQARIAGNVATSREDNLRKATRMAQGRPGYDFGLAPARSWSPDEVLDVMARRCGVRPDPTYLEGPDTIDVELTLAADAPIVGRTVGSVTWPTDSALVAILRAGRVITPSPDDSLEAGDELLLVATAEVEDDLDRLLTS